MHVTEIMMRILAFAILTTVWVASPVRAQTYSPGHPVCLHVYDIGGDRIECDYNSLAQCAMSASGRSAECEANPYFANAQGRDELPYGRHRETH
jgi:hypothetical protein